MNMNKTLKLVLAIGASLAAGAAGSLFTAPAIPSWYAGLVKPALNPPSWVFGPVWTVLYLLMGISLFLIWKSNPSVAPRERRRGVILFFIQLALNAIWSPIFFGSTSLTINGINNIGLAFIDIVLLWAAIALTILVFRKISRPAAWLLAPYLLWVSFALYLNYALWMLN